MVNYVDFKPFLYCSLCPYSDLNQWWQVTSHMLLLRQFLHQEPPPYAEAAVPMEELVEVEVVVVAATKEPWLEEDQLSWNLSMQNWGVEVLRLNLFLFIPNPSVIG